MKSPCDGANHASTRRHDDANTRSSKENTMALGSKRQAIKSTPTTRIEPRKLTLRKEVLKELAPGLRTAQAVKGGVSRSCKL